MNFASNPLRLTLGLLRQRHWLFIGSAALWLTLHLLPVLPGVLAKGVVDALDGPAPAGPGAWTCRPWSLTLDLSRIGGFVAGIGTWATYWIELTLHLRHNILNHLRPATGSRRLPESPSESVTRFRDDVNDVGE